MLDGNNFFLSEEARVCVVCVLADFPVHAEQPVAASYCGGEAFGSLGVRVGSSAGHAQSRLFSANEFKVDKGVGNRGLDPSSETKLLGGRKTVNLPSST